MTHPLNTAAKRMAEIRERERVATPGPWVPDVWFGTDEAGWVGAGPHHVHDDKDLDTPSGFEAEERAQKDSQFIAHARQDIPWLLAHVEQLEKMLGVAEEALAEFNRKYSPGDNWNPEMRDALIKLAEIRKGRE